MTKYTATFADGTQITRKTDREYKVAWRSTWTGSDGAKRSETGFSVSREKVNAYKPTPWHEGRGSSASQRSEARKKNAEFLVTSGYRVEIVNTVAA